jgi:uncharacterized protein YecT (DUF1311 family)
VKNIIFLALLASTHANAEDADIDYCTPDNVSSQGVYECSVQTLELADTALNDAYKRLHHQIAQDFKATPKSGKSLKAQVIRSQRTWLTLRERNCKIETFVIDATSRAHEAIKNYCLARQATERTKYLSDLQF